jgi:hypothetical protein
MRKLLIATAALVALSGSVASALSLEDMQGVSMLMMMYNANCENKIASKYKEAAQHVIDGMTEQEVARIATVISVAAVEMGHSKFCESVGTSMEQYK